MHEYLKIDKNFIMKIIFLDIDGPLANDLSHMKHGTYKKYDEGSCGILNSICELSGAKIVLTSTNAINRIKTYNEICNALRDAGLDPKHLHKDWTARIDEFRSNGKERSRTNLIKRWLLRHPDVTHYTILDDDKVHLPNFVPVSRYSGIMAKQFYRAADDLDFDIGHVFDQAARNFLSEPKNQLFLPFSDREIGENTFIDKALSL